MEVTWTEFYSGLLQEADLVINVRGRADEAVYSWVKGGRVD